MKNTAKLVETLDQMATVLFNIECERQKITLTKDSISGIGGQHFPDLKKRWERQIERYKRNCQILEIYYNELKKLL